MNQAVVLCAGRGLRLGALSANTPKAMLPILGKPLILHIVDKLAAVGFSRIILVVGCHGDQLESLFGASSNVQLCHQPFPAGTADALRCAASFLDDRFFLTYGDLWVDINDYNELRIVGGRYDTQQIGVIRTRQPRGAAVYVKHNRVHKIVEKPTWKGTADTCWNASGLYILKNDIITDCSNVKKSARMEFELPDAIQLAIDRGSKFSAFHLQGSPIDIGIPERYAALCATLMNTSKSSPAFGAADLNGPATVQGA
jgi:NDP-sugar pyrophosphorylase family protein